MEIHALVSFECSAVIVWACGTTNFYWIKERCENYDSSYFLVIMTMIDYFFFFPPINSFCIRPSSNSHHTVKKREMRLGLEEKRLRRGTVWIYIRYIYLTDLCQAWCQQGWQRQQAPNWASAHGAFQAVWSCPRGSGCRYHDQQSNPLGKTPVVQGYDYLRQRDLDLAQYLLKIQLQ